MLKSKAAVQAITKHLNERGIEVKRVALVLGGPPEIYTKSSDQRPELLISFLDGVETCCGAKHEPGEWKQEVRNFKAALASDRVYREEHPERFAEFEAELAKLKAPLPTHVDVLCVCGTATDHERELRALSEELDRPLMVIDEELRVASAGL